MTAYWTTTTTARRPISVDEAFAYCANLTNAHYENFPVASLLLPAEKRPYLQAVYAFARIADDFADEGHGEPQARLASLDDWNNQLALYHTSAMQGAPLKDGHPVFVALAETIRRNQLPLEPLRDLLTAFKMDVTTRRYATFGELLHYCRHSANPVGRLVLQIFGYQDKELLELSDKICTALQLANFWQDISVDFQKNRIYIPMEDFANYGYTVDELAKGEMNDRFKNLIAFEIERTREMFYEGASLPSKVDKDLRLELKLVWFGGMAILKKTERYGVSIVRRRPSLNSFNKFMIFMRSLFYPDISTYRAKKLKDLWDLT